MYIGRSFVNDDLALERSNYIASIMPGFIIYNVSLIAVFAGFTLLIKFLITSNFSDITQLFNYKNDLIKEASFRDQLTNLYNRHKFEDIKDDSLLKAQSIGIIMLDANGLKLINDTYGHTVGDELLVRLANLLKQIFYDDMVFRWGGDEFIVVMKDIHEDDMLKAIKRYKNEESKTEIKNFNVSAALGYAVGHLEDETVYEVIGRAEGMMYKEKTRESISVKRNMVDQLLQHLYEVDELEEYHAKHVAEYALILGRGLKLPSDQMRLLRLSALLHDVGKIGIDGDILMKSKPLTKDEYDAIKNHAERGYRILSSYTDLKQYADIVLSHHEWFDGNGYPEGIKGENIDVLSRVIAIADAFEAMTHTRTYKMTKTYDEAIQELITFKGVQFDPMMVDVFVKIMTKERFDKMQKAWQQDDEAE
jgi:diguanylate cyclase (GGDEF)-like protein/putative nucleotidyltransferase with HDIG domain